MNVLIGLVIGLFIGTLLGMFLMSLLSINKMRDAEAVVEALSRYIFCIDGEVEHGKLWKEVEDAFYYMQRH